MQKLGTCLESTCSFCNDENEESTHINIISKNVRLKRIVYRNDVQQLYIYFAKENDNI